MGWGEYVLAFATFFLTHSLPIRPPLRPRLVALGGAWGFLAGYSLLSLGALAWLISAAGRAPFIPLWDWAPWQNDVVLVVMLAVCLILALAVARPNPFSFGGRANDRFDPARPGLVRYARHPLLLALALWSGAHLVPNGDLAHVILFAVFAAFALIGGAIVDRRRQREMGADWQSLLAAVKAAPPAPWMPPAALALRLTAGILLYAGLLWLHPLVIGVSPIP